MNKLLFIILIKIISVYSIYLKDPYEILGVKKTDSINEIKRNYKNLIKIWHPDKLKNLEDQEKFVQINEAYQLLMDPIRREEFDKNKITQDTPNFKQTADYSSLKRFENDDEDFYSNETNYVESFGFNSMSFLHKQTISHKAYSTKIIPLSTKHPQLILFYSDSSKICPLCSSTAVIWQRITKELSFVGIHLHTINVDKDNILAKKIGININQIPAIIGIVDEVVKFYKEEQISLHKVVSFIRKIIRNNLVKEINDSNYKNFLTEWKFDNKIRILFVNQDKNIRLRYLITAFKFKEYSVCGHISIESKFTSNLLKENSSILPSHHSKSFLDLINSKDKSTSLVNKYKLNSFLQYMLIFNENLTMPINTLVSAEDDLKPKEMWDAIEANKFLLFPKITSQKNFEEICPVESMRNKRILCSILILSKFAQNIEQEMLEMRVFIQSRMLNLNKFKFAYITLEDQKQFVSTLMTNKTRNFLDNDQSIKKYLIDENNRVKEHKTYLDPKLNEYILNIVIISRTKWNLILYEWFNQKWDVSYANFHNETQNNYYNLLIQLSSPEFFNNDFTYETKIIPLNNENEKSFFGRLLYKLFLLTEYYKDHFSKREILQIISVILSISFIALIGYTMQYLVKMEERKIEETYKKLGKRRPDSNFRNQDLKDKLLIHELKGETYNGLVRLLKPGCRTIVLLCDLESRNKLLPKFYKAVYPYRRNKTLMFAYLMLEKNVDWYRKILEQALDKHKSLFLNPKNCIGTVLSLNGFRKYFCVYHAKHMELQRNMNSYNQTDNCSESDTSDVECGNLLNEKQNCLNFKEVVLLDDLLLDALNEWLNNLFNSKTHKYFINYWPNQIK